MDLDDALVFAFHDRAFDLDLSADQGLDLQTLLGIGQFKGYAFLLSYPG